MIWTFNSIDLIYILTYGGPYYSTFTLAMFAYQQAFGRGLVGYASAVAVFIVAPDGGGHGDLSRALPTGWSRRSDGPRYARRTGHRRPTASRRIPSWRAGSPIDNTHSARRTPVWRVVVAFVVTPFLWMLLGSFKPTYELLQQQGQTLWIAHPTLENYQRLFQEYDFVRYFLNSLFVATVTATVATSLSAFAGYSLARFQFPGRGFFGVLILVTQMLPGIAIIIPLFIWFKQFQLIDTYWALLHRLQRVRDSVLDVDVARLFRQYSRASWKRRR